MLQLQTKVSIKKGKAVKHFCKGSDCKEQTLLSPSPSVNQAGCTTILKIMALYRGHSIHSVWQRDLYQLSLQQASVDASLHCSTSQAIQTVQITKQIFPTFILNSLSLYYCTLLAKTNKLFYLWNSQKCHHLLTNRKEKKKKNKPVKLTIYLRDCAAQTLQTKTNPDWNLSSQCCWSLHTTQVDGAPHPWGLDPADSEHFPHPCAIWLPLPSLQDKEHELTYHSVVEVIGQHPLTHSNQQPKGFFLFGIQQQHGGQNIHRLTRAKKKMGFVSDSKSY